MDWQDLRIGLHAAGAIGVEFTKQCIHMQIYATLFFFHANPLCSISTGLVVSWVPADSKETHGLIHACSFFSINKLRNWKQPLEIIHSHFFKMVKMAIAHLPSYLNDNIIFLGDLGI